MKFNKKLAAGVAVVALGAAALFAQAQQTAQRRFRNPDRMLRMTATALNMTDAQRAQARTIFQQARQSAQPVRQQLRETRKSLQAAVQSGNTGQIQQLASTEGSEIGQLTAIRSEAFAKVYQTLTPEQQQKLNSLEQARHGNRRGPAAGHAAS